MIEFMASCNFDPCRRYRCCLNRSSHLLRRFEWPMVFKLTDVARTFMAVVNHLQGSNNFTEKLGISGLYHKYKKKKLVLHVKGKKIHF